MTEEYDDDGAAFLNELAEFDGLARFSHQFAVLRFCSAQHSSQQCAE